MTQIDPIIAHELPMIQKVIQDEMWYEGERRGCYVPPDDPVVRDHVGEVILRLGRELCETLMAQIVAFSGQAMLPSHGVPVPPDEAPARTVTCGATPRPCSHLPRPLLEDKLTRQVASSTSQTSGKFLDVIWRRHH